MATTYVQLTREEFEDWLNSLGHRWKLKPSTVGIYMVPLSDTVAVEISSSMTGRDDVMNRAQASMGCRLVSLITGFTLNKKAQEQSHVKRTINWRDNLKKVFQRMVDAYEKSSAFYDALAEIRDRDAYKREWMERIEAVPGWQSNSFLADMHERLADNGIMTVRQRDAVERALGRPQAAPAPTSSSAPAPSGVDVGLLAQVRALYAVAKQRGNQWVMDFSKSVGEMIKAGRNLSSKQQDMLERLLDENRREVEHFVDTHPQVSRVASAYLAQMGDV
jgi:hypothetical protein